MRVTRKRVPGRVKYIGPPNSPDFPHNEPVIGVYLDEENPTETRINDGIVNGRIYILADEEDRCIFLPVSKVKIYEPVKINKICFFCITHFHI